jgi:hypothetical protein
MVYDAHTTYCFVFWKCAKVSSEIWRWSLTIADGVSASHCDRLMSL